MGSENTVLPLVESAGSSNVRMGGNPAILGQPLMVAVLSFAWCQASMASARPPAVTMASSLFFIIFVVSQSQKEHDDGLCGRLCSIDGDNEVTRTIGDGVAVGGKVQESVSIDEGARACSGVIVALEDEMRR